jgi:nitrogen fixation protein FixH
MNPPSRKCASGKPLTGRKVLAIALIAFAVILTPNLILAFYAVSTFSGIVVPNSYIASQTFNERRRAQEALAWRVELDHGPTELHLRFIDEAGSTVRPAALSVVVGRPTTQALDEALHLTSTGAGYAGRIALDPGNWIVLVEAKAEDGTPFSQRHTLYVPRS